MPRRRHSPPRWATNVALTTALFLAGGLALLAWWNHAPSDPRNVEEVATALFKDALPTFAGLLRDATVSPKKDTKTRYEAALSEAHALAKALPESVAHDVNAFISAMQYAAHRALAAEDASTGLEQAVVALNGSLRQAALPFYVDAELVEAERTWAVVPFTFRIETQTRLATPEGDIPVLALRRIDGLNWKYSMVAYAAEGRREVVVILDRVDGLLAERVEPFLESDQVGSLWGTAQADLERWDLVALESDVREATRSALTPLTTASLRERFVESLGRHEAQHVLDRGHLAATRPRTISSRAWAETSAYLAELARDQHTSSLALAFLIGYAVTPDSGAEGVAARHALQAIADAMDLSTASLPDMCRSLLAASPEQLRAAAGAAWSKAFQRPLPAVEPRSHSGSQRRPK